MNLTTWTIYQGKKLKNLNNEVMISEEFPFLLLRPDLNQPNEYLGMAINHQFVSSMVNDLINRKLNSDQLIDIFQDKMGLVNIQNLSEYFVQEKNFSTANINESNIENLMETYNILIKSKAITFNSQDYDVLEKLEKVKSIFLDFNLEKMPMHQLIKVINSGMPEFYHRLNELKNLEVDEKTHQEKIKQMVGFQTNLIFFFEQTLKKMDQVIGEQNLEIKDLKKQLKPKETRNE